MPRAYADISALISQKLQDTGVTTFAAAEINYAIEEQLKEFSKYQPHLVEVSFEIESRFGTATSTSANNLVDASKSQFAAADATDEKVIYNDTDKTWAVVTSYSSTSQLGLSADIMASGERYYIYNKRCRNEKQLYIGDVGEYSEVVRAEYPTNYWPRRYRNIRLLDGHDVVELKIDFRPDESNPALTSSRTEVILEFQRPHILSQLTDWAGEVNNASGYAAAATSMALDGLQSSGTIEEGEEFTLENQRTLYQVTADATISANAATISFYPGLEAAAVNNDDITFVKSTLSAGQESLFADMVVNQLIVEKGITHINTIPKGGPNTWQDYVRLAEIKLQRLNRQLRRDSKPKTRKTYSRL